MKIFNGPYEGPPYFFVKRGWVFLLPIKIGLLFFVIMKYVLSVVNQRFFREYFFTLLRH